MIHTQEAIDARIARGGLSAWQRAVVRELADKVDDDAFPCTFGTHAYRNGRVRFAFVEPFDPDACARGLAGVMAAYARFVTERGPVAAALRPLAIAMPPQPRWPDLDAYRAGSWELLGRLHRLDPEPWPERVPLDPDSPRWSFCFAGVPFFVNFKTPHHRARRSRRLRSAYLWLVQARDGFDQLAGDNEAGHAARAEIRELLAAYDEVGVHPALTHYGTPDNREWRQYFLDDDNRLRRRCPFHPDDTGSSSSE